MSMESQARLRPQSLITQNAFDDDDIDPHYIELCVGATRVCMRYVLWNLQVDVSQKGLQTNGIAGHSEAYTSPSGQ